MAVQLRECIVVLNPWVSPADLQSENVVYASPACAEILNRLGHNVVPKKLYDQHDRKTYWHKVGVDRFRLLKTTDYASCALVHDGILHAGRVHASWNWVDKYLLSALRGTNVHELRLNPNFLRVKSEMPRWDHTLLMIEKLYKKYGTMELVDPCCRTARLWWLMKPHVSTRMKSAFLLNRLEHEDEEWVRVVERPSYKRHRLELSDTWFYASRPPEKWFEPFTINRKSYVFYAQHTNYEGLNLLCDRLDLQKEI